MATMWFFSGIIVGYMLTIIIRKISTMVTNKENVESNINVMDFKKLKAHNIFGNKNIIIVLISGLLFLISFFQIGFNMIFIKALVLNCILIVVSFIDIEHEIIPDKIIIMTLVMGVLFSFVDDISFLNAVGGMLLGGGIMLLLAIVPGVLGGGDIKLMFAVGIFLGIKGALVAIFLAFIIASVVSMLLLLLKIKGRKDYIPFGPFLSIGSFIALNFTNIM